MCLSPVTGRRRRVTLFVALPGASPRKPATGGGSAELFLSRIAAAGSCRRPRTGRRGNHRLRAGRLMACSPPDPILAGVHQAPSANSRAMAGPPSGETAAANHEPRRFPGRRHHRLSRRPRGDEFLRRTSRRGRFWRPPEPCALAVEPASAGRFQPRSVRGAAADFSVRDGGPEHEYHHRAEPPGHACAAALRPWAASSGFVRRGEPGDAQGQCRVCHPGDPRGDPRILTGGRAGATSAWPPAPPPCW